MTPARDLSSRLADLLRREQAAMADFLLALADFDRRKLWRELGHASLFYYLHRELGLSRGAAHYRKVAAELIQRFPEIEVPLRDGRLCITSLVELGKVITPENQAAVLPRFFHRSKREAKEVSAELRPAEAAPHREVVTAARAARLGGPGPGVSSRDEAAVARSAPRLLGEGGSGDPGQRLATPRVQPDELVAAAHGAGVGAETAALEGAGTGDGVAAGRGIRVSVSLGAGAGAGAGAADAALLARAPDGAASEARARDTVEPLTAELRRLHARSHAASWRSWRPRASARRTPTRARGPRSSWRPASTSSWSSRPAGRGSSGNHALSAVEPSHAVLRRCRLPHPSPPPRRQVPARPPTSPRRSVVRSGRGTAAAAPGRSRRGACAVRGCGSSSITWSPSPGAAPRRLGICGSCAGFTTSWPRGRSSATAGWISSPG
jgi:hypothetical protein